MILFLRTGSASPLFRGKQALQKRELYNIREGELYNRESENIKSWNQLGEIW